MVDADAEVAEPDKLVVKGDGDVVKGEGDVVNADAVMVDPVDLMGERDKLVAKPAELVWVPVRHPLCHGSDVAYLAADMLVDGEGIREVRREGREDGKDGTGRHNTPPPDVP